MFQNKKKCKTYKRQSCKKTFFLRYLDFLWKIGPNLYVLNFAKIWYIKFKKCLVSLLFSSFGVELCQKSTVPFYSKYSKISSNYLKMSGFLLEMSDILDTRILPFGNSEQEGEVAIIVRLTKFRNESKKINLVQSNVVWV